MSLVSIWHDFPFGSGRVNFIFMLHANNVSLKLKASIRRHQKQKEKWLVRTAVKFWLLLMFRSLWRIKCKAFECRKRRTSSVDRISRTITIIGARICLIKYKSVKNKYPRIKDLKTDKRVLPICWDVDLSRCVTWYRSDW